MKRIWLICCLSAGVLLSSCDRKRVFDSYQSIEGGWHRDSIASFQFSAPDTINSYDLFINLRNTSAYPYSNLYLITNIRYPNGKVLSDTLQYEMTTPAGEWLGTGFGEVKENKLWFKENFTFSEKGTYSVELRQAMRQRDSVAPVKELAGVTEVGFRIEQE